MTHADYVAGRNACDLLGLGSGCRDGGCVLYGPGTTLGAQRTNGGCHCLMDHRPKERRALQAAIKAAAKVFSDES